MKFIRIDEEILNLDNVLYVDLSKDKVRIRFAGVEAGSPGSLTFEGQEAKALRAYFLENSEDVTIQSQPQSLHYGRQAPSDELKAVSSQIAQSHHQNLQSQQNG